MKKFSKIFCAILAFVMMISACSINAFAATTKPKCTLKVALCTTHYISDKKQLFVDGYISKGNYKNSNVNFDVYKRTNGGSWKYVKTVSCNKEGKSVDIYTPADPNTKKVEVRVRPFVEKKRVKTYGDYSNILTVTLTWKQEKKYDTYEDKIKGLSHYTLNLKTFANGRSDSEYYCSLKIKK